MILGEKLALLKSFDDKIILLVEDGNIEDEVASADDIRQAIQRAIVHIDLILDSRIVLCDICQVWAILVSMFPSFPRYKEGTGGRGQIEPGPLVLLSDLLQSCSNKSDTVMT